MSAPSLVLVPIDGSPASLAALEHAIALVEDEGGTIDILVVNTSDDDRVLRPRDENELLMEDAIDRAIERLPGRILRLDETGDPLQKILEMANGGPYELIVMGTHGRIGRLHTLLGSVAEEVVRNAPCPVLTVRDATGGYQSFADRRHGRPTVGQHGWRP